MISLTNETVQRIIDDIIGEEYGWKADGGVCEGYRINVGRTIRDIDVYNFKIDRLRMRINTITRIQRGGCTPLVFWTFCRVNTSYWQLRLYDGEHTIYEKRPDVQRIPLYEEMTANHMKGRLTLAEYMLMQAYDGEREDSPRGDLLDDFVQDAEIYDDYYADSGHLYDHIARRGCSECVEAIDEMVAEYRAYCVEHRLEADPLETWREEEERLLAEEEEDE